jgi:TM2 domain-containing membrane protein YozV
MTDYSSDRYAAARYEPDEEPDAAPRDSDRSRGVALALAFFGGFFGLHRFYTGKVGTAFAMLFTMGGFGIWWLYDVVVLAAGEFRDADDRVLRSWEPGGAFSAPPRRDVEKLAERLDSLEQEVGQMAERLDFTERLLAQEKARRSLPSG